MYVMGGQKFQVTTEALERGGRFVPVVVVSDLGTREGPITLFGDRDYTMREDALDAAREAAKQAIADITSVHRTVDVALH